MVHIWYIALFHTVVNGCVDASGGGDTGVLPTESWKQPMESHVEGPATRANNGPRFSPQNPIQTIHRTLAVLPPFEIPPHSNRTGRVPCQIFHVNNPDAINPSPTPITSMPT